MAGAYTQERGHTTHRGLVEESNALRLATRQSRNCSCGTYFHSEMYAGVEPSPPLLVAYAPRITPTITLAPYRCYLARTLSLSARLQEGEGNVNSPVNPQLSGSFDASINNRASDLRAAGPAENV